MGFEDICETVEIISKDAPGGICIINKCDLQDGDVLVDKKAEKSRRKGGKTGDND